MPKTKQVYKPFKFILGLSVVIALVLGVVSNLQKRAEIAEVAGAPLCTSSLASFTGTDACVGNGFKTYSYTCTNGKTGQLTSPKEGLLPVCLSFEKAHAEASGICGQNCITPKPPAPSPLPPSPTPTPTPTPISTAWPSPSLRPSPPPTADPSAKPISCELKVYKIARGANPNDPYVQINPSGATVNVGDRLAYDVSLTNPNTYSVRSPLTFTTTNLNGDNEPIIPVRYDPLCSYDSQHKTLRCNLPEKTLQPNSTVGISNAQFTVEVAGGHGLVSTGIGYNYKYGAVEGQCMPYTVTFINQSPSPRPIPRRCIRILGRQFCWPTRL